MSQIEKIIKRFKSKPEGIKYKEMDRILKNFGFDLISTKGSHKKYKNPDFPTDIIIPVHNNECKDFYKKQVHKQIKKLLNNHEN